LLSRQKYDVIVADLFAPSRAGTGSLYTLEHYNQCKAKLRPGGIMCQWLPPHQLSAESLSIIVNTFRRVFPHTSLWLTRQSIALIGTQDKLDIDYPLFEKRFNTEKVSQDLSRHKLNDPLEFLTGFAIGEKQLAKFVAQSPINTDNNPAIEFKAPQDAYQYSDSSLFKQNLQRLSRYRERIFPDYLSGLTPDEATSLGSKLEQYYQARSHTIQGKILALGNSYYQALSQFKQAWDINPREPEARMFLEKHYIDQAEQLLERGALEQAQEAYQNVLRIEPESIVAHLGLASIYYTQKQYQAALEEWRQVLSIDPHNLEAKGYMELTSKKLHLK
jgi:tetratricopeptide (TPR) repeat protein